MKVSNLYIYGSREFLSRLEEEYMFMGRQVRLEDDRLVVFALPRRKRQTKSPQKGRSRRR